MKICDKSKHRTGAEIEIIKAKVKCQPVVEIFCYMRNLREKKKEKTRESLLDRFKRDLCCVSINCCKIQFVFCATLASLYTSRTFLDKFSLSQFFDLSSSHHFLSH